MCLYIKRFFSRLLDYGLFYCTALVLALVLPFDYGETFYYVLAAVTPLLWAPFEAVILKKWGATVGKKLFELSIPSLSWKEVFKRAFFCTSSRITFVKPLSLWRAWLAFLITCSVGSSLFFGKNISEVAAEYEQQIAGSEWVQYTSDEGNFLIHFPKTPKMEIRVYDVPDGDPIRLNEYRAYKEASFCVSYLNLPKKWRLFSANTLLKGAIKVVQEYMPGSELVERQIVKHKNYPAMNFCMKQGEAIIEGRLILVGRTLYQLTVTYYPDTPREQQHETFLNSFELKH